MNYSVLGTTAESVQSGECRLVRDDFALGSIAEWEPAFQVGAVVCIIWVVLEIAFLIVLHYVLLPNLHKLKQPVSYHGDIIHMMKRTLDQVTILDNYSFEMFVEGFCNAAKYEDVCVDNYRSFLSWLMFHKHLKDLDSEERAKLEHIVEYTEDQHPQSRLLKPGFNETITHCRMTLEPLPVIHRPLLLYLLANLTELASNALFLQGAGYQRFEVNGMKYWYKEQSCRNTCNTIHGTSSDGTEPMVFMHGISTGWMVYLPLVKALAEGRTTILIDLDAIKIKSLNFDMPTPEQYADRVRRVLDRHRIGRASIVGHSFGSITAGWIVRYLPERVSHMTLIDPVSLLLGLPNVAYSFLYRQPSTLMEWIIHVIAARELTISYSLRRHFYWYNNNLWLEDIPAHIGVVVGVATHDEITSGPAVHEYASNCRKQRQQLRESSRRETLDSVADCTAAPKRVTRSTSGNNSQRAPCLAAPERDSGEAERYAQGRVAAVEAVLWEGFSHGQVLLPSEAQRRFVQMVHANEKLGCAL